MGMKMKNSINKQFAFIFIGLMMGTIMMCWLINSIFLEQFYLNNKITAITEAYKVIETAIQNDVELESEEFDIEISKITARNNISILVLDSGMYKVIAGGNDNADILFRLLLDNVFLTKNDVPTSQNILKSTDNYILQSVDDSRVRTQYLEMWGNFDGGYIFMMRCPMESISESVSIANRFLMYVGIGSIILSAIVIFLVANKVTRPILELTEISGRMIHLDFDAKYTGKTHNEIEQLGENMNQLSDTLKKTISELKTANNELKTDIQEKEEIDEKRKEFLSNVSHELKTPIALIQGYAEGLKEGINDDEESRNFYCEVIMDEATKMNMMVKKLMSLNELESGTDHITMERFSIVNLITNYIQSVSLLTNQNEIMVKMEDYAPVYVWADELKVEEVFANFFTNAINHAANEKVIEVKLTMLENTVRISVFNTGSPIPEDSLERIWDKFYKVDKARTREYGGSGIGLSIVKAIMDSLNQKYGVINYENGVEFWFELDRGTGITDRS